MDRKTLHKISYGLYVVCSGTEGNANGQIANTIMQITAQPPTVAVSINKENYTYEFIKKTGVFTASIIDQSCPMKFIGTFGFKCGRDINKFDSISYKIGKTGAPVVLDYALAYLEMRVINEVSVGTHTIFVGELVDAEILTDGIPLTYDYYHAVKHGKTPKTAATYVAEETETDKKKEPTEIMEEKSMDKYQCSVCGYIYDPEKGDPDNGVAPGTAFDDLADDWTCPVCGASKDQFEKMA